MMQWLKEDDDNTSFFYAVANGRKNKNCIPCVTHNSDTVTEPKEIGKVFVARFQQQFGSQCSNHFLIDFQKLLANKNFVDLLQLERTFLLEEVKSVVFDLAKDKALGPDGFPLQFFRQFWELIKTDLIQLCEDFYQGKTNLKHINWANIALIPKVETLKSPGDFRPISLINSKLKISSKILATRLSAIMNALVDSDQLTFLKGRCILDNIATMEVYFKSGFCQGF